DVGAGVAATGLRAGTAVLHGAARAARALLAHRAERAVGVGEAVHAAVGRAIAQRLPAAAAVRHAAVAPRGAVAVVLAPGDARIALRGGRAVQAHTAAIVRRQTRAAPVARGIAHWPRRRAVAALQALGAEAGVHLAQPAVVAGVVRAAPLDAGVRVAHLPRR